MRLEPIIRRSRICVSGVALTVICSLVCPSNSANGQLIITAGSSVSYNSNGGPDPLTGSWFQSLGPGEATLHYGKTRVPENIEGRLLSPGFAVYWNLFTDYGPEDKYTCTRIVAGMKMIEFAAKAADGSPGKNGLLFSQASRRWYLCQGGEEVIREKDILPPEAEELVKLGSSTNLLISGAGSSQDWKKTCKLMETLFERVVFRRDGSGRLVLGLVSKYGSKIYIPPVIANVSPEVFGEFKGVHDMRKIIGGKVKLPPWPYNSSTNILVSDGPYGCLLAEGELEYLLLGWEMLMPNFGRGTKVSVKANTGVFLLVDENGNQIKVNKASTYVNDGGKWIEVYPTQSSTPAKPHVNGTSSGNDPNKHK